MCKWIKHLSTHTAIIGLAALAILVCLVTGTAAASEVHVYSKSFGNVKGELSLTAESGIAVSNETSEAYVADTGHSRVAKFSALGIADGSLAAVTSPTFIAVDNSQSASRGDVYVVGNSNTTVSKFTPGGSPVEGWGSEIGGEKPGRLVGLTEILGIAVDAEGNLWVFDRETSSQAAVSEFGQLDGDLLPQAGFTVHVLGNPKNIDGSPLFTQFNARSAGGIAVDSNHLFYLFSATTHAEVGGYARLNSAGEPVFEGPNSAVLLPLATRGIATELLTNDVYSARVEGADLSQLAIYRFSAEGEELERFGGLYEGLREGTASQDGLETVSSIAVDSVTGEVYVVDPSSKATHVAAYALEEVEAPSTSAGVSEVTQHAAKLIGHVNPNAPAGSSRAHETAWRVMCTPACPGHETASYIEADGNDHLVEVTLNGLVAGTEYTVTLQAENRGGASEQSAPFTTAPAAPSVTDQSASEIYGEEATLSATVNPNGAETSYYFEYMTSEAFTEEGFGGVRATQTAKADLPEKAEPVSVSARVSELAPSMNYVYRAVAENVIGAAEGAPVYFRSQVGSNLPNTDCPNQSLRTGAGANLPDCRAYELASPVEKAGGEAEPYEAGLQAAFDGSAITWYTGQTATGVPTSGEAAHQDYAFYLSTKGAGEWTSQRLLVPGETGVSSDLTGLTPDQKYGLVEASSSARSGAEPALYLLNTADHGFSTIVAPQVGANVPHRAFSYDGASANDELIFFECRFALTPNAVAGKDNLYVWNRLTGVTSLVGALPGSKAEAPIGGSFGGAYAWWGGEGAAGPQFGGAEQGMYVEATHAISINGDRAYFTAGETGQIYLRSGLTSSKPATVRVSVANAGVSDSHGQQLAAFQEATPDGEMAFFISNGKLTEDANTGPNDEGTDLYRYDAATKALVDVAPISGGAGARVQGLLGIAANGRSGFLVAEGVLASGGTASENNLYHFEEVGGAFTYEFVTTLGGGASEESNWSGLSTDPRSARVSEQGNVVLFMAKVVDDERNGACQYTSRCAQVYRFETGQPAPVCISCNPTEEGLAKFGAELSPEGGLLVVPNNDPRKGTVGTENQGGIYGTMPRNLSPSGNRLFFQTSERLLPEDTNGNGASANCTGPQRCGDVYEWESIGTGTCKVPNQGGGCLYLLSTGKSGQSSYFLDASGGEGEKGGESVFILTRSSLVPVDEDELFDVYDARVDGGLAGQIDVPAGPCESRESCGGAGASPAPLVSPATPSFQGPGNVTRTHCKKGFVRKGKQCVRKPKKHKHSHRKKGKGTARTRKGRTTDTKHAGGAK